MQKRRTRPVRYISIRNCEEQAKRQHYAIMDGKRGWHPKCRGKNHSGKWAHPNWHVRWEYKGVIQRAVSHQSLYWCDDCLPMKYRYAAEALRRSGASWHRYKGKQLQQFGIGENGYRLPPTKAVALVPVTSPRPQARETGR